MLLIYSQKITKRLNYIFNLIFKEILGVEYEITDSLDKFSEYKGYKINYSKQAIGEEIFFASAGLLFETGVKSYVLKFIDFADSKAFFPVFNKKSFFPFDPFSAAFFLVTRYEEYLPYIKDKYGRFVAAQSIAYKNDFLQKPLVNIWAKKIKEIIHDYYPDFIFPEKKYQYIPTFDIDSAYSYKLKGFFRSSFGYLRDLKDLNFKDIILRTKVLLNRCKDPFDTYDIILELKKKYGLKPIVFILFGDYGEHDKNISNNNRKFHVLIKSLSDYFDVGVHPSFGSGNNFNKLEKEVKNLSDILNKNIKKSRQHYLRIDIPTTYHNLLNLDITDDYSMGYASAIGFRASICSSFFFYDLDYETETKLRIHPFAIMDGTLKDYLNLDADNAILKIKSIVDDIKAVNGTFISLWHNETLSDEKRWKGWLRVFYEMIEYAIK